MRTFRTNAATLARRLAAMPLLDVIGILGFAYYLVLAALGPFAMGARH